MKTYLFAVSMLATSSLMLQCASQPKVVEKKQESRYIDSLVGRVSSFEPSSGIVLMRTFGSLKSEEGEVFLTRSNSGFSGNIRLTGQANKFFVAAEYKSGSVNLGDSVYRRKLNPAYESDKKEKPEEEINNSPEVEPEAVQEKPETVVPEVPELPVIPDTERIPKDKELPPIPIFE